MRSKSIWFLVIILLIFNSLSGLNLIEKSDGEVLPKFYVDDDYDSDTPGWQTDHFDNIQDAINQAGSDDRILVYSGTYTQNLLILSNKTNLDLFGEDKSLVTIKGQGGSNNDVIIVNASGVDISSFTIRKSGTTSNNSAIRLNAGSCVITDNIIKNAKRGIFIEGCNSNTIYYNTITSSTEDSLNTGVGIYLNNSDSNSITHNTITSCTINGIFSYSSSSNTISNCTIQSNSYNGIFMNDTCNSNVIKDNNISSNSKNGIFLNDQCNINTIKNNTIELNTQSGIRMENSSNNNIIDSYLRRNSDYGIMVVGENNLIRRCDINRNSDHGVFLFADNNNIIIDNDVKYNTKDGIRLVNSTSDTIRRNKIISNSQYGIYLNYYSINNQIYNNKFENNYENAMDLSTDNNDWEITKTSGTNIINGSYKSGNYWEDYDEVSEGITDTNSDGIANNPYTINISSSDNGVLVDNTNPYLRTPSCSPSSQSVGENIYFSCLLSDNDTDIKAVSLNVVLPNGSISNYSIIGNITGNIYYCYRSFTTIGNYTFYYTAMDTRNWVRSSNGTFYIHQGNPPSVTDNSPSSASPATSYVFNATVTSGSTSASDLNVYVNWSHSTFSGNNTMSNTGGNYFEKTITLATSTDNLNYFIFAYDKWGNKVKTTSKTITISDTEKPSITVTKYGKSYDDLPDSHTFTATVTDNCQLSRVYIDYWYGNSDVMTANMTNTVGNTYKKVITPEGKPDKVFCIIYAVDSAGNTQNTKNPTAEAGGTVTGFVTESLLFNGSGSYDLDGNITSFTWDFGDGTIGSETQSQHSYSTDGTYIVTLTVIDNNGNTDSDTTTATVTSFSKTTVSNLTKTTIENRYDINLSEDFYAYDTDVDGYVDTFVDPNNVLLCEHDGNISINGDPGFLLSVNGNKNKIFIWNAQDDTILNITFKTASVLSDITDEDAEQIKVTITISKSSWVFIESEDRYPDISSFTVKKSDGTKIESEKYWRKNNKIYIVDDPDTTYHIFYPYTPPPITLNDAVFSPSDGSTLNQDNPTITITYNIPVTVKYAEYYQIDPDTGLPMNAEEILDIKPFLETSDDKSFTYTPDADMPSGRYYLDIYVEAQDDPEKQNSDYVTYDFESYKMSGFTIVLAIIGSMIGIIAALFFIIQYKNINFESFIYFKNKKIIPFFKPVIFGPLKIDVNDEKVSKAEFYVNGQLKETITEEPFVWHYREPAFLKQNIETKVYDDKGDMSSSGEMTFYMFNPFRSEVADSNVDSEEKNQEF